MCCFYLTGKVAKCIKGSSMGLIHSCCLFDFLFFWKGEAQLLKEQYRHRIGFVSYIRDRDGILVLYVVKDATLTLL